MKFLKSYENFIDPDIKKYNPLLKEPEWKWITRGRQNVYEYEGIYFNINKNGHFYYMFEEGDKTSMMYHFNGSSLFIGNSIKEIKSKIDDYEMIFVSNKYNL